MAAAQTREQQLAALLKRFPQADTNKDGRLTVAEAKVFQNKQRRANRKTVTIPPTHADVVYGSHPNNVLDLWLVPSAQPTPLLVFIHGGDLIHGDRTAANFFGPVYETSINSGNVLISIDYRLAPQTKLPEIVRDVEDAIDWVRRVGPKRFNVDPNQVVVMGSSSGAYLALVSGYRVTPPPKAIVSFAGSGDLVGDWHNTPLIDLKSQKRIYSKREIK